MEKREKSLFLKTCLAIFSVLLVEAVAFSLLYGPRNPVGYSVADLTRIYSELNPGSKIFLLVQWLLIIVILAAVFVKSRGSLKSGKEEKKINLEAIKRNSKTSLDAMYEVLKMKKEVSVRMIASMFKISEDLAMDWARILESGDLIVIEYPAIGGPVAVLKEEKSEEESSDKNSQKNLNEGGQKEKEEKKGAFKSKKPKKKEMGEKAKKLLKRSVLAKKSRRERHLEKKAKKIKRKKILKVKEKIKKRRK